MSPPRRIYLDYNATAPLRQRAREAMAAAAKTPLGNPSSPHREGRAAHALLDEARRQVAQLLGAQPEHVVFTSGGTEAVNAMMVGAVWAAPTHSAPRMAITATDHACVRETAAGLRERGCALEIVPVDAQGRIETDAFTEILERRPTCVVTHWANNETGVLQDVDTIGALCRNVGVPLCVDAVQAAGKLPLDFEKSPASAMAVSAHKIGGPAGVGALVLRNGMPWTPLLRGGHQEYDRRAGTEPVLAAVGFGAAAAAATDEVGNYEALVSAQRNALRSGLARLGIDVTEHGAGAPRIANSLNVQLAGFDAEALVQRLDLEGVAVGIGAACASGAAEPSPVLLAMGVAESAARESVRWSLGYDTTAGDIAAAVDVMHRVAGEWSRQ